jgi:hypothetical protein
VVSQAAVVHISKKNKRKRVQPKSKQRATVDEGMSSGFLIRDSDGHLPGHWTLIPGYRKSVQEGGLFTRLDLAISGQIWPSPAEASRRNTRVALYWAVIRPAFPANEHTKRVTCPEPVRPILPGGTTASHSERPPPAPEAACTCQFSSNTTSGNIA